MPDKMPCGPGGRRPMFLILALALILSVAFFYLTEKRRDRGADKVTEAASKLDGAADRLGDAAQDAANRFGGH